MPKYVPDLQQAAATSEANFIKLQKIFPAMADESQREIELFRGNNRLGEARIRVLDRSVYTTTLAFDFSLSGVSVQQFFIRIYSDARMAEVVLTDQGRQMSGVYPYPNDDMYHKDEKNQLNKLLSEALSTCMAYGIVAKKTLQV